jgi:hypothetical protein
LDLLYNQQQRALSKGSPSSFSWRAISSMYKDVTKRNIDGRNLYREFIRKYDANKPLFDKVVANFDENGVRLKTRDEQRADGANANDSQKTVDSMAKRASAKLLNK